MNYNHFPPKVWRTQSVSIQLKNEISARNAKKRSNNVSWWPAKCNRQRRNPKSNIIKATVVYYFVWKKGWEKKKLVDSFIVCNIIIIIKHTKSALTKLVQEEGKEHNMDQLPTVYIQQLTQFLRDSLTTGTTTKEIKYFVYFSDGFRVTQLFISGAVWRGFASSSWKIIEKNIREEISIVTWLNYLPLFT